MGHFKSVFEIEESFNDFNKGPQGLFLFYSLSQYIW